MEVEQPVEEQVQEAPLNRETAIQKALKVALTRGAVVKGISEVLKALEAQKVKVVFLADNCDNDQYKATILALAKEHKVPVLNVDTWENLKDYCRLGLLSSTIKEIAEKYYDGPDPIGKTHVREGVVARILNRPNFAVYKHKNFSFRVLEGIIKDEADAPDMEEAQEVLDEMAEENGELVRGANGR